MITRPHPATIDAASTFARWLSNRPGAGPRTHAVGLALWRAAASGHSCLPVHQFRDEQGALIAPSESMLLAGLGTSVGAPDVEDGSAAAIIHDQGQLYLARLHRAEVALAHALRERLNGAARIPADSTLALLRELFAGSPLGAVAGLVALQRSLAIVVGGPGTGKTWTVLRLLALLHAERPGLRVAVAAPTGKAAQRLRESLARDLDALPPSVPETTRSAIAAAARAAGTLHRLLGFRPDRGIFTHHAGAPLAADAVVIDEASMVDLPLFAALLAALRPTTTLILLGDACQLASVETGVVLGDLSTARGGGYGPGLQGTASAVLGVQLPLAAAPSLVSDVMVELLFSRRFADDSGIGRVAHHLRRAIARQPGAPEAAWAALSAGTAPAAPIAGAQVVEDLAAALAPALAAYRTVLSQPTAALALRALDEARVLSPVHGGPTGVEALVVRIERSLGISGHAYRGRPILISANDAATGLANGDVGILWPDAAGTLCAWFPQTREQLRAVPISQLPAHVTAWAMTVHKSQGSEFSTVVVVVPALDPLAARQHPLSAQLLYTAATRARQTLVVCSTKADFIQAAKTQGQRGSRLAQRVKAGVVS